MQIFGSRGWVEVGDVEHLTTWQMRVCFVDPDRLHTHHRPHAVTFPRTSTERAELENFAAAVRAGRPLAVEGGDEQHGVAVLEAILKSARSGRSVQVGGTAAAHSGAAAKRGATKAGKAAKKAPAKAKRRPTAARQTAAAANKTTGRTAGKSRSRVAKKSARRR
jgi:hypothetical protein